MENDNVFNGTIGTVNNANVEITEATTLGELLSLIGEVKRADKIPSPKALRETAGNPLIETIDSKIYANGYAVYDNGSGRTVLWLPNCVSFTYHLNPLKESEKGGDIKETCMLPEGLLESQPWPIAVTLIGEHRIETLVHHRKSDRKESKTLIRGDNEEGDAMEDMEGQEDYPRDEYIWNEGRYGEDPLQYVLRKERQEEIREALTDKQWEVFVLYFREGFKQQQICEMLGISRNSVIDRLECAIKKIKKIF